MKNSCLSDYEIDKIYATFCYNAYTNRSGSYELLIRANHLKKEGCKMVLEEDACRELQLNCNLKWLELGFKKFMWHIRLKWYDGAVLFSEDWYSFLKAGNIHIGDMCLFMRTSHEQKFEIAIFERDNIQNFNKSGEEQGKGILKWFQIVKPELLVSGQLHVARIFADNYGTELLNEVTVLVPDGMEFVVHFSRENNMLSGFKDFLKHYLVAENFMLFFEYVGSSAFFVSIYNENGFEIFNDLPKKLLLKTVLEKFLPEVIVLTDSSEDNSKESLDYGMMVRESSVNSMDYVEDIQPLQHDGLNNFTVVLMRSHVDQNGHGVYIPQYLQHIYSKWNKGTVVTLLLRSKPWKVAVLPQRKTFRFGIGWNHFTIMNKLRIGQKLRFSYVRNQYFEVEVIV